MAFLRQHFFPFLLLVLLCITKLSGSAPVPAGGTSLSALELRDEDFAVYFTERSLHDLADRAVDGDDIFVRSVAPQLEENVLVRRKSIFNKIKDGFKKVGKGIKNAAKKVGEGVKKAAKKVGDGVKKAAKKVGDGVKKAAKKVGEGVKTAAKKVGNGVKTAAKKVGKFVKENGAKVAKFGMQVWSTAQSVAAKAAKFIPGVGKPISKALDGASKVTDLAAHKIPAKLGNKLEKGFKVMDKIKNPVGGAAGAVLNNVLRRDIDEDEILFERYLDFEDNDARDIEEDILLEREGADFEQVDARETDENVFLRRSYEDDEEFEA